MSRSIIEVTLPDGGQLSSYLATCNDAVAPGVVVVSSIFGVDAEIKDIADRLAQDGFIVSAPDLFWRDGKGPIDVTEEGLKQAMSRGQDFDLEQGMKDVARVIDDLKSHPRCNGKIAVMGFCFGGLFAFLAAARLGIDAGISFHGSNVGKHLDATEKIKCPMSFHYGDSDRVAPMEEVESIKSAFARLENANVYVYPGAGHGYMLPSRGDEYFPEEAAISWKRAMRVLTAM